MRLLRLRDLLVLTGLLALLLVVFSASTARASCPYPVRYAYTPGYYPAPYHVAVPYRVVVPYRRAAVLNYHLSPGLYTPYYAPLPVAPLRSTTLPGVYYW
jgi:hypothetical protein